MGLNIKKTRRSKKALELVCIMLGVDDKVLNAYIETGEVPKTAIEKDAEKKAIAEKKAATKKKAEADKKEEAKKKEDAKKTK